MRSRAYALVALLALAACRDEDPAKQIEHGMAGAQAGEERQVAPGAFMTMFRTQATSPLPDGWQLAVSTKGGFSVELPLPFNDFRLRSTSTDGVQMYTDTVGGKTAGKLAWSATCVRRADNRLAPTAATVDEIDSHDTPPLAWRRTLPLPDRSCVAIVEAQGSDALPPEADIQRFLHSLKPL